MERHEQNKDTQMTCPKIYNRHTFLENKTMTILSRVVVLTFLLTFIFFISTAFAASDYSAYVVSGNDTAESLKQKQVIFNDMNWYVLEDDSTSETSGHLTLFASDSFKKSVRFDRFSNKYSNSEIKSTLEGLTAAGGDFESVAGAIKKTDLPDVNVTGAKLYLLSNDEALSLSSNELKKSTIAQFAAKNAWWLRTPTDDNKKASYVDGESGEIFTDGLINPYGADFLGLRPALKLDLSLVIFSDESQTFSVRPYSRYVISEDDTANEKSSKAVSYKGKNYYIIHDESTDADSGFVTLREIDDTTGTTDHDLDLSSVVFTSEFMTFTEPGDVAGVRLSPADPEVIAGGDAVKLTVTVVPEDATNKRVLWYAMGNGITLYSDETCKKVVDLDWSTAVTTVYVKVTALGSPKVTVKSAADESKGASATITVSKPKAVITKEPTANDRFYDGQAQPLLNDDGECTTDEFIYAVGSRWGAPAPDSEWTPSFMRNWHSEIPTATDRGTYYVWCKAVGDDEFEESDPLGVSARIEYPVTFKVEGGAWDDGTTEDKIVPLSRYENEDLLLVLTKEDVPEVGNMPDYGYTKGAWDATEEEMFDRAVSNSKTFTYSYVPKSVSANITFRVENGDWDDGTSDDKVITLSGNFIEDERFVLSGNSIPTAGSRPDDGYKAGDWDVTPSANSIIKQDITYTYSYIPIPSHMISVMTEGNGNASASMRSAKAGTNITLTALPDEGWHFVKWEISPDTLEITDYSFIMPDEDVLLKAIFEADPAPEPEPEPEPEPVDNRKFFIPDLGGATAYGKPVSLKMYLPDTVYYNGKTHVAAGTKLTEKQSKKMCADLPISVEGLPAGTSIIYKYKKTKNATDSAFYTIKLNADKDSSVYKTLSKEDLKSFNKELKTLNKALKDKKNRAIFTIKKLDLGKFTLDKSKSNKEKTVFVSSTDSKDTLTVSMDKYEIHACISGTEFIIPKKDFKKAVDSDTLTITGKDKNVSGKLTVSFK
ncbi:MAG: hypothetical protein IKR56_07925 [Lachnospiraceae bacterium]|nr:hypothetical protein [Lachnospiraceae bacterium]